MLPMSAAVLDPPGGSVGARRLLVSGRTPGVPDGEALVTFELERDAILDALQPVDPQAPDSAVVQSNWSRAVNKVVVGQSVPVKQGAFSTELTWDRELPAGPYYVKVYAQGAGKDSAGFIQVP
jgi:hypothetical protein